MKVDAKKLIDDAIGSVLNEYAVTTPEEAMDAGKKIKEAIKQEEIQDREAQGDASLFRKATKAISGKLREPLTSGDALAAAAAIAAGLGAVQLAKKLRAGKKLPSPKKA